MKAFLVGISVYNRKKGNKDHVFTIHAKTKKGAEIKAKKRFSPYKHRIISVFAKVIQKI